MGATINFDASVTTSYTLVSNKLSSWTDVIGSNTFTQTIDSQRPTLTTQNGLNAFDFNKDASQFLSKASPFTTVTFGTYIVVYSNTNIIGYSSPISAQNNGKYLVSHGDATNTLFWTGLDANTWANKVQIGTPSSATDTIPRSYVNNLAVITQTMTSLKTSDINGIGYQYLYPNFTNIMGKMCEIVFFPTQLSDADRITAENHLMNKWGI